jgi:small subunit ribosomal protein S5
MVSFSASQAMEKAFRDAKKNMLNLKLTKEFSIPHETEAKYSSSRITLRPARGRGVAAGSSARVILNLAGVKDVSAKVTSKSKNKLNNARATMKALEALTA